MTESGDSRRTYGRRELIAAGAIAGSFAGCNQLFGNDGPALPETQREFETLATTVDETDLTDPRQSDPLKTEVDSALSTARAEMDQQGIEQNQDPNTRTETQLRGILSALEYYRRLSTVLAASTQVCDAVRGGEFAVFFREDDRSQTPAQDVTFEEFDAVRTDLAGTFAESEPDQSATDLLPRREPVQQALQQLPSIYEKHIQSQQAYLDAARWIEAGAVHREDGSFGEAKTRFEKAIEATKVDVPADFTAYAVASGAVTLGEYEDLLSKYRSAASKMATACVETTDSVSNRDAFDAGLELLFTVREEIVEKHTVPL